MINTVFLEVPKLEHNSKLSMSALHAMKTAEFSLQNPQDFLVQYISVRLLEAVLFILTG